MLDEKNEQKQEKPKNKGKLDVLANLDIASMPQPIISKKFALLLALRQVEAVIDCQIASQFPTTYKVEITRSQFHNGVYPTPEIIELLKTRYGKDGWVLEEQNDSNTSYGTAKKIVLK